MWISFSWLMCLESPIFCPKFGHLRVMAVEENVHKYANLCIVIPAGEYNSEHKLEVTCNVFCGNVNKKWIFEMFLVKTWCMMVVQRCKHETALSVLGLLTGKRRISIATECGVIANLTLCRLCDFAFSSEIRFATKKIPCDIKMKYAFKGSQILCEFQIYYTNHTLALEPCALFQGICPFTHFGLFTSSSQQWCQC